MGRIVDVAQSRQSSIHKDLVAFVLNLSLSPKTVILLNL